MYSVYMYIQWLRHENIIVISATKSKKSTQTPNANLRSRDTTWARPQVLWRQLPNVGLLSGHPQDPVDHEASTRWKNVCLDPWGWMEMTSLKTLKSTGSLFWSEGWFIFEAKKGWFLFGKKNFLHFFQGEVDCAFLDFKRHGNAFWQSLKWNVIQNAASTEW